MDVFLYNAEKVKKEIGRYNTYLYICFEDYQTLGGIR